MNISGLLKSPVRRGHPWWGLRAAISLSRVWHDQVNGEQGRQMLNSAYEKFTEGFTTADLIEARELLR